MFFIDGHHIASPEPLAHTASALLEKGKNAARHIMQDLSTPHPVDNNGQLTQGCLELAYQAKDPVRYKKFLEVTGCLGRVAQHDALEELAAQSKAEEAAAAAQ